MDVYLQCPHKDPMAFYRACGFLQINLQDTTGLELLPKTIADTLHDETAEGFAWIVPESDEHCIIPLMQLCSGSLLNTPKEVLPDKNEQVLASKDGGSGSLLNSAKEVVDLQNVLEDAGNAGGKSNVFLWCQYPPSISDVDNAPVSALLTNVDLEEAHAGLHLLNNLLPPPFGLLVSPEKMRCSGEMVSHGRLNHSKSGGKTWMATGELQMMAALLMKDGRYEESVAILSFTDMQLIQGCFELLQKHLSAKKYEKDLNDAKEAELCAIAEDCFKEIKDESMKEVAKAQYVTDALDKNSAVVCALVKKKFGGSKDDLYSRYDDQMNQVVKNVLIFHPGLLQKRIIVFPTNLRNNHWGATFVFNAGGITAAIDDASSGLCMTCFLLLQSSFLGHNKDSRQDRNHLVPSPSVQLPGETECNCKSCQNSKPNEVA